MKLRNKKTGEIVIVEYISDYQIDDGTEIGFRVKNTLNYYSYPTLAELNKEWEDYKPAEPLIKDEKVRKAVRAWADANEIETVKYDEYWVSFRRDDKTISFKDEDRCLVFYGLENSKDYTIAELCEEENEED